MLAEIKELPDYEYIEDSPSSWRVWDEPHRPSWFEHELKELGGLNRHGAPHLRLVWGGNCVNDHAENQKRLKYHCGYSETQVSGYRYVVDGVEHFEVNIEDVPVDALALPDTRRDELGLPRWIIERWVSPETLEQQKRFRSRSMSGDAERVLRSFPREGVYDTYFIVENKEGLFRQLDRDVLAFLKGKWAYDKLSFEQQEKDREEFVKRKEQESHAKKEELIRAAVNFDIRLPKDEKERRLIAEEAVKNNLRIQEEEAKRLTFYQSGF